MIEWFQKPDPESPYLKTADRVWTYGEALDELDARVLSSPVVVRPSLDAEGVFNLLAGVIGGGAVVVGPGEEPEMASEIGDSALVVFTSGTSGAPKGVRLSSANLEASAEASMDHLSHGADDTWLLAMPLNHVGGISILVRSAYAGGSVRLQNEFDPVAFSAAMKDDVTMVSVVPTMLRRIIQLDDGPYPGVRAVLVGGGSIAEGLLETASDTGLPVLPTYGMTETFGQVATLRPGEILAHRAHLLPGVEMRVEPDGRLGVKGRQVFVGYLGEPDRVGEWFITSDLGEIDADGAVHVHGRTDNVIVSGGESVNPERIEGVLSQMENVDEALVFGVPSPEWGTELRCVYSGSASGEELKSFLKERLPAFMVPKLFVVVDEIPHTSMGKPDRAATMLLGLGN